ncbi:MAG: hypothetical protein HDT44_00970 [Ruminococcaceae bacterium]|nr:hypothetical protein [Oscillospiraceae bacterium]
MKSKFLKISAVITAFAVATASAVFYAPARLNADEFSPKGGCEGNHEGFDKWNIKAFTESAEDNSENVKYYLTESVELESEIHIKKNITICLSGFEITVAENSCAFYVEDGGSLTICDCDGDGKIKSNEGSNDDDSDNDSEADSGIETLSVSDNTKADKKQGGAIYIKKEGKFTLKGGTISNFSADEGGGVYSNGTFTMTGGVISDNNAKKGGGVYVAQEGKGFEMSGGKISDNTVTHQGGGVYVSNGSSEKLGGIFTMNGGIISGNIIKYDKHPDIGTNGGAGVYTAGQFIMNNNSIISNNTSGEESKNEFFYGGGVSISNGGVFTMNGGTISVNKGRYGGGVYVSQGTFTMAKDSIIDNNRGIAGGGGVGVDNAGVFTLNSGKITNNEGNSGGGVYNKGTFIMKGGTIGGQDGENTAKNGGGVYLTRDKENNIGGIFTMSSGSVSNNKSNNSGGGIYIESGTFTINKDTTSEGSMNEGVISSNTSQNGGGVYINSGAFNMSGGSVLANTTSEEGNGGGVYIHDGSFTMSGGSVLNNTSKRDGGGVYQAGGDFTMSEGSVSNNTSQQYGGGVYLNDGDFTINHNSSISNNTSQQDGGGVYQAGGYFTMNSDSSISNNTSQQGGGVYLKDGSFTMKGGAIKYNTVFYNKGQENGNGYNIYVCLNDLESGGAITLDGEVLIVSSKNPDDLRSNIFLKTGRVITIGKGFSTKVKIGIHPEETPNCVHFVPVTKFTDDAEAKDINSDFDADRDGQSILYNNAENRVELKGPHDISGEWRSDNEYHWYYCINEYGDKKCEIENTDNKILHNFDKGVIIEEATTTKAGTIKYTCVDCKYSYTKPYMKPSVIVTIETTSDPDPGQNPDTDPEEDPDPDPGQNPDTDPEEDPNPDPGQNPDTDPEEDPDPDPGQNPDTDPGQNPDNPNQKPSNSTDTDNTVIDGDNATTTPNPSTGLAITLAPLGTAAVIAVITSKRKKK